MGHTLVTRFTTESNQWIHQLMQSFQANKIPFGRNCDRIAANDVLDYHMTLFHWPKTQDEYYLNKIKNLKGIPFKALITDIKIMYAEESSFLLYFSVTPKENFADAKQTLEQTLHTYISDFLHITLAVSMNYDEILTIKKHIEKQISFPFAIDIEGFDLYHIWKPTRKVKSF